MIPFYSREIPTNSTTREAKCLRCSLLEIRIFRRRQNGYCDSSCETRTKRRVSCVSAVQLATRVAAAWLCLQPAAHLGSPNHHSCTSGPHQRGQTCLCHLSAQDCAFCSHKKASHAGQRPSCDQVYSSPDELCSSPGRRFVDLKRRTALSWLYQNPFSRPNYSLEPTNLV